MAELKNSLYLLMKRALAGEDNAERELYDYLFVRFTSIAKRIVGEDAEDLAQEACLTVLEKYKTAEFHQGPAAWAHRVLKNKIGNFLQGTMAKQKKTVTEDTEQESLRAGPPELDPLLTRDLVACLRKMTSKNTLYSRVLNLSFQGFKTEEICQRLGIKASHMYVVLNRGREMMKNCLETGRV